MFSSIRTKLTILYVGILAAFIFTFAAVTYYALLHSIDRDLNGRLLEMSRNFSTALTAEEEDTKDDSAGDDAVAETTSEMRFRDYQFIVYSPDGKLKASTADFEVPFDADKELSHFDDVNIDGKAFKLYRTRIQARGESLHLFVIHSLDEKAVMQGGMGRIFLIGVPITLLLAGFCGYFLARRSLAPVVEMGRQANRISARNLNERLVAGNERDELGQLAGVLNDLLERLDEAFKQQRRFMADASHELRTPLAIVRGESEVALSKQDRSTHEYRESLAIVHGESERLTRIVEDLFTLARADAGQFRTKFAPVYLDEIVGDAVRSIAVLARNKSIRIDVSTNDEMPMNADESLLRRLFLNLLDNAVKYGRPGGCVSVKCESGQNVNIVTIIDDGIGILPKDQNRIFERFYRVDKARSRSEDIETSGAGLGLAITKWIAEIHQGRVELISSNDKGSIFSVTFPR
jgi:heavy metal sensor kinase